MKTSLETVIAKTATMIRRWDGHRGRFLELTRSHRSLIILIGDDDYGTNLWIACLGPRFIQGPTEWQNSTLQIAPVEATAREQGVLILDEENGVRVVAEWFEVKENVKW